MEMSDTYLSHLKMLILSQQEPYHELCFNRSNPSIPYGYV